MGVNKKGAHFITVGTGNAGQENAAHKERR
jgi:hypothetical protein